VTHYRTRLLAAIAARKRARVALAEWDLAAYRRAFLEVSANYEHLDESERKIYADVVAGRVPDPTEPPC
jgi:hypothetical protein